VGKLWGPFLKEEGSALWGDLCKFNYILQQLNPREMARFIKLSRSFFLSQEFPFPSFLFNATLIPRFSDLGELQNLHPRLQILDFRNPLKYMAFPLPHTLYFPLKSDLTPLLKQRISLQDPLLFLADLGFEEQIFSILSEWGYLSILGVLELESLSSLSLKPFFQITPRELAYFLDQKAEVSLLDIRPHRLWREQHLENSLSIPLERLLEEDPQLPLEKPILVYGKEIENSALALNLLRGYGYSSLIHLIGGFSAWKVSGLPVFQPL
jgi:rhodanese-related sulfurtransferase